jgi:hypothetical protein
MTLSDAVRPRYLTQTLNPLAKSRRLFNPLCPLSFLSQTMQASRHKAVRIASDFAAAPAASSCPSARHRDLIRAAATTYTLATTTRTLSPPLQGPRNPASLEFLGAEVNSLEP